MLVVGTFIRPHLSSFTSTAASMIASIRTREAVPSRFEMECVQFFSEVVQVFGIPKSVGQIYGSLYASPRPLRFTDIVEQLEISKGSASQGMQLLRDLGAINEACSSPGVQASSLKLKASRILYEPELSLRPSVSGVLRERIAPMSATSTEQLAKLKALAEQPNPESGFYLARAKQLNTWRRRLRAVMPVLGALLGPKRK